MGKCDRHLACLGFVVVLVATTLSACRKPEEPHGGACTLDNGVALDVTGRDNGIFGVRDGEVDGAPLARLDRTTLQSEGVDAANGKRWLRLKLAEDDAKRLEEFTSGPTGRSIAVVAAGQVVSHHKIRQPLRSAELQVSCCDSRACGRLHGVFAAGDGGAHEPASDQVR